MVIALIALFFALGGSALAVSQAKFQARCAGGAILATATVVGNTQGLGNIPDTYTSDGSVFVKRFTCKGQPIQVRRVSLGAFDVRFPGNPSITAIGSGLSDTAVAVSPRQPDGSFRVTVFIVGTEQNVLAHRDLPFTIVAI